LLNNSVKSVTRAFEVVCESALFVLYESYLVIYVKECEDGEGEVAGEEAKLGG